MNAGVVFLCMAAAKAYYTKIVGKMDKAQTKMDMKNTLGHKR